MTHYKLKEIPDASLGRVGFIISSAGGIVMARLYGEECRKAAGDVLNTLNGTTTKEATTHE